MERSPHDDRAWSRLAIALLALALLVALLDLGGRMLVDQDVPRTGGLARENLDRGTWLVPYRAGEVYANKPPLYLWLVMGTSRALGAVTPFSVRLPSALALVLLVLVTATWARERLGSDRAGLVAGLLALSTFFLAWLGREGRLDMLAAALTAWATLRLDRAARAGASPADAAATGVLLGLALLTKGPLLLLVPLAVLLLDPAPRGPRRGRAGLRPVLTLAVAALVALAWFVPAVLEAGGGYARALLLEQGADRVTGQGNHLEPPWHYLVMLPAWALPWGPLYLAVLVAGAWPRLRRTLTPVGGLATAALALVVLFSLVPTKHVRYLAPAMPLLVLPATAWLLRWLDAPAGAFDRASRWLLPGACVAGAVGIVVAGQASRRPSLDVLVPAVGVLAAGLLGPRALRAAGARPRQALAALVAIVFATSAGTLLRSRFRDPPKVRFLTALRAGTAPGETVFTVPPAWPEDVVDAGRPARRLPEDGPWPTRGVLVTAAGEVAGLLARHGGPLLVRVPPTEPGGWIAVDLGAPDAPGR